MTPRDRFRAMMEFTRPDEPFVWTFETRKATMDEWLKQGYPEGVRPEELLGYGWFESLPLNTSHCPVFAKQVVEEQNGQVTYWDEDGALRTDRIDAQGSGFVTRKWLRFPVESREDFLRMTERYDPDDMNRRASGFDKAIADSHTSGYPIMVVLLGFYWTMRQWLGFEGLSTAFYDCPELVDEMLDFILAFNVGLLRRHLKDARIDCLMLSEDMAYKTASMMSPRMARDKLVPRYRELVQEAKASCADTVFIDCDGHISELIPLWIDAGIDGTSPVEIAAEQDIVEYAERYPDFLFLGGIDKRALSKGFEEIRQEVISKAKALYSRGGWIPAVDHAVPTDVPFENFRYMIELLKSIWGETAR